MVKILLKVGFLLSLSFIFCRILAYVIHNEPHWAADKIFFSNIENILQVKNINNLAAYGTGVIVKTKNNQLVILTNRHICKDFFPRVYIENHFLNGVTDILYQDEKADLCLIKLPQDLKVTPTKVSTFPPSLNEEVYSIGYPLYNDINMLTGRVIGPIISATRELYTLQPNCKELFKDQDKDWCILEEDLVATNIFTFPGNSGSPVMNSNNELVGLIVSTDPRTHFGQMIYLSDIQRVLGKF